VRWHLCKSAGRAAEERCPALHLTQIIALYWLLKGAVRVRESAALVHYVRVYTKRQCGLALAHTLQQQQRTIEFKCACGPLIAFERHKWESAVTDRVRRVIMLARAVIKTYTQHVEHEGREENDLCSRCPGVTNFTSAQLNCFCVSKIHLISHVKTKTLANMCLFESQLFSPACLAETLLALNPLYHDRHQIPFINMIKIMTPHFGFCLYYLLLFGSVECRSKDKFLLNWKMKLRF